MIVRNLELFNLQKYNIKINKIYNKKIKKEEN